MSMLREKERRERESENGEKKRERKQERREKVGDRERERRQKERDRGKKRDREGQGREDADIHRDRHQRHEEGHTDMCRVARQHRKSHLAAQPSACASAPGPRVPRSQVR